MLVSKSESVVSSSMHSLCSTTSYYKNKDILFKGNKTRLIRFAERCVARGCQAARKAQIMALFISWVEKYRMHMKSSAHISTMTIITYRWHGEF